METNLDNSPKELTELLAEAERAANRYTDGKIMLIRTKEGWRAFLGGFNVETQLGVEKALGQNLLTYEKAALDRTGIQIHRSPDLLVELSRLMTDCFEKFGPDLYKQQ